VFLGLESRFSRLWGLPYLLTRKGKLSLYSITGIPMNIEMGTLYSMSWRIWSRGTLQKKCRSDDETKNHSPPAKNLYIVYSFLYL
jgi:hypothetical protein